MQQVLTTLRVQRRRTNIDLARNQSLHVSKLSPWPLSSHSSKPHLSHLSGLLVLVPAAAGETPGDLAVGGAGGVAVRLSLVGLAVAPDPNPVKWQVHVDKLAVLGRTNLS